MFVEFDFAEGAVADVFNVDVVILEDRVWDFVCPIEGKSAVGS